MFEINRDAEGIVHLSGRLDASQVEEAKAILWDLKESTTLDLSGLDYISSAGIGVIVESYKRLNAGGHSLRLTRMTRAVKNVFTLTGLDRILTIE